MEAHHMKYNESVLVRNTDISHNVLPYRATFESQKIISFELMTDEYRSFMQLAKSYKLASESEDFDALKWINEGSDAGLFDLERAGFVFNFLMLEWRRGGLRKFP